jgi:putative DNA-invertase from lambdoid prophage Rac
VLPLISIATRLNCKAATLYTTYRPPLLLNLLSALNIGCRCEPDCLLSRRFTRLKMGQQVTVYGYARVSTIKQVDEGESLETQQRTLTGYALMHGMELDRVFVERGVSGSKPMSERPQGAALLATIRPGDTVITPKLDRMFRSALDALGVLADLKARGIALHMIDLGGDVSTNGVSKLVFTILSAVAEAERDRTRERIAEVKRDQRTRGRYLGGTPPFGWRVGDDGGLVAVPEQQKALDRMRALRAEGLSLHKIAVAIREEGLAISHMGVKKILAATRLCIGANSPLAESQEAGIVTVTCPGGRHGGG